MALRLLFPPEERQQCCFVLNSEIPSSLLHLTSDQFYHFLGRVKIRRSTWRKFGCQTCITESLWKMYKFQSEVLGYLSHTRVCRPSILPLGVLTIRGVWSLHSRYRLRRQSCLSLPLSLCFKFWGLSAVLFRVVWTQIRVVSALTIHTRLLVITLYFPLSTWPTRGPFSKRLAKVQTRYAEFLDSIECTCLVI